jgi:choline dehydrogenase-like flavoprotein
MNTIRSSYDVVIVGAGVGGGTMANQLAKAGAKVLVIERGTRLPREADNWSVKAVFHEKRYTTKETWRDRDGQEFNPSTYYYVGGNSKFFGTATIRFRVEDFEDLKHEAGVAPAWPISYAELTPYYDVAEQLFGTHGTAGMDPCEPPRSGPMPHPAIGHEPEIQAFDTKLRTLGLKPFPLPVAIDLHPGGKCIRCRTCDGFACKLGAKNDAEVRMIDPAIATGNVDLILESKVNRLITDDTGRKAVGVEVEQMGGTKVINGDLFISSARPMQNIPRVLATIHRTNWGGTTWPTTTPR